MLLPHGVNDFKKLTPEKREELYAVIFSVAEVGIGIVDVAVIDRDNILQATYAAMIQAVANLKRAPQLAFIDGNRAPKLACLDRNASSRATANALSIAAASIVAKVHARPDDDRARPRMSGLWLRPAQGLWHARASGGA